MEMQNWLNEWASRKDRYHAPMTAVDALNDLGFQMALEKQLDQQTCIEHAFPAEDEAERVEELGTLDDPEFEETTPRSPASPNKRCQVQQMLRRCLMRKVRCWTRYRCQTCQRMSVREGEQWLPAAKGQRGLQ